MELRGSQSVEITSFGGFTSKVHLFFPASYEEISEILAIAVNRELNVSIIGGNQSFSNVAHRNGNVAIDLKELNKVLNFDINNQTITVQAGIKVTDILKTTFPYNLTINALTGSHNNTVGGDISSGVNGKDAWKWGNFSNNVLMMKVMLANGNIVEVDRENNSSLFHAIVGGLGLIALILEVTLKLRKIQGVKVLTEVIKCKHLSEHIKLFQDLNENDDFAFSWTDNFVNQKKIGRGIFEKAQFVETQQAVQWNDYLEDKGKIFGLKAEAFWGIVRGIYKRPVHQFANTMKYHTAKNTKQEIIFPLFQYPMTKTFPKWNLLFYPKGFREFQMLFSFDKFEQAYTAIIGFCQKNRIFVYICAIKRHSKGEGNLSFQGEGLSFTINFGINKYDTTELNYIENKIIELCVMYGGKIYLSKFPFINGNILEEMYPSLVEFLNMKKTYDSDFLFYSNAMKNFCL